MIKRFRYWLIKKLAGRDMILINGGFSPDSSGAALRMETLSGRSALIADCVFYPRADGETYIGVPL